MDEFLRLSEACSNWTSIDRSHGIQAAVDDESYLQRCALPALKLSVGCIACRCILAACLPLGSACSVSTCPEQPQSQVWWCRCCFEYFSLFAPSRVDSQYCMLTAVGPASHRQTSTAL